MNPVLILTHNCLELTKRCVDSVRKQDIHCLIEVIDNGSTDGTEEWLSEQQINNSKLKANYGVSKGWNQGLRYFFQIPHQAEHVLVVGNDTILPAWFYSSLLSYNLPFVSGVAVDNMEQIASLPERSEPVPNPDFSCFFIKKDVWEKVGPFDEAMVSWASDCDFHVRAHRLGIPLWKANVPFFHVRSRTIELAPPPERRMLEMQADADRLEFASKWKAEVGGPQYADLFSPDAFGIDL